MRKFLHITGIVLGYVTCAITIVVGILNRTPGVDGWKFVLLGAVCAVCATIALLDGARAFPTIGWWKVGAKYEGLSDLATVLIVALLAPAGVVVAVA